LAVVLTLVYLAFQVRMEDIQHTRGQTYLGCKPVG
jgi:hypothetical protein